LFQSFFKRQMFGFGRLASARFFRRTCHIATLKQFKMDVQLRCHRPTIHARNWLIQWHIDHNPHKPVRTRHRLTPSRQGAKMNEKLMKAKCTGLN
jgi:hypothetical protein